MPGRITATDTILAMRMAHGSLRKFDPKKELVEHFHEHFEFYCMAKGIQDDNAVKKR